MEIPTKTLTHNPDKPIVRQLGFAFAQFATKEDADNAIAKYNGEKFKQREIFIKKAIPPPTPEEKEARNELFKAKKEAYLAKKQENQKQKLKPKQQTSNSNDQEDAKIPEGNPSSDTIFITNLDYRVNVKTLNSIFKELKPKWIHVPTKKVPYHILKSQKNRKILNKGIAFIKFPSHEVQKKAVEQFNGKEVNGRPIIVDIAIDTRIPKDIEEKQSSQQDPEPESENQVEEK